MAYAYPGDGALDYFPCRYGNSKLLFRGPGRALDRPYCAALGGSATYGKFVPQPYPALVEAATGLRMVNLGCMNAGVDAFLNDAGTMEVASGAALCVVQVLGAQNLSNRFYAVHPRRNDRFLRATPVLRALFRDVDFTEFHFTRHLLQTLQAVGPDRFEVVAAELRATWMTRMAALLAALPGRVVILWLADRAPAVTGGRADLSRDPMLVDAEMIRAVRGRAAVLEVVTSPSARAAGVEGMAFAPMERHAAAGVPGLAVHREVASALGPVLAQML